VSQKQGGQHAESFEAISSGRLAVAHDMTFRNNYVPTPDGDMAPEKRNCTLKDNTPYSEVVTYAAEERRDKSCYFLFLHIIVVVILPCVLKLISENISATPELSLSSWNRNKPLFRT
jgi:hypothetical protein